LAINRTAYFSVGERPAIGWKVIAVATDGLLTPPRFWTAFKLEALPMTKSIVVSPIVVVEGRLESSCHLI
jgi:hypothetical protein